MRLMRKMNAAEAMYWKQLLDQPQWNLRNKGKNVYKYIKGHIKERVGYKNNNAFACN